MKFASSKINALDILSVDIVLVLGELKIQKAVAIISHQSDEELPLMAGKVELQNYMWSDTVLLAAKALIHAMEVDAAKQSGLFTVGDIDKVPVFDFGESS